MVFLCTDNYKRKLFASVKSYVASKRGPNLSGTIKDNSVLETLDAVTVSCRPLSETNEASDVAVTQESKVGTASETQTALLPMPMPAATTCCL